MTIKKDYSVGDTVWIYGITRVNKPTEGKVVHKLEIPGFSEMHYIISVPTEIEPLLEIRTWHNISQDAKGPIGAFRDLGQRMAATQKFVSKVGFTFDDPLEELDEPTAEEIHAAIEKSQKATIHQPLHIKEHKPRRRFNKKKQ